MMTGSENDVIDYIDNCRKTFKGLDPEEVSFPVQCLMWISTNLSMQSMTRAHRFIVVGALFNHYIKQKKLTNKYSLIQNGEKIKFLYLKKPNPIHENVLSFIQEWPKELDLNKYIDYDLQFEKAFLEPLKIILDSIGWSVEKTTTLEAFFA